MNASEPIRRLHLPRLRMRLPHRHWFPGERSRPQVRDDGLGGCSSAEAERVGIQAGPRRGSQRRIEPITGTAKGVARACALSSPRATAFAQFDCINTTNNTNSFLLIFGQFKLLAGSDNRRACVSVFY